MIHFKFFQLPGACRTRRWAKPAAQLRAIPCPPPHLEEGLQRGHRPVVRLHPLALLQRRQARAVRGQELGPALGQAAGGVRGAPPGVALPRLHHRLLRHAAGDGHQLPQLPACRWHERGGRASAGADAPQGAGSPGCNRRAAARGAWRRMAAQGPAPAHHPGAGWRSARPARRQGSRSCCRASQECARLVELHTGDEQRHVGRRAGGGRRRRQRRRQAWQAAASRETATSATDVRLLGFTRAAGVWKRREGRAGTREVCAERSWCRAGSR